MKTKTWQVINPFSVEDLLGKEEAKGIIENVVSIVSNSRVIKNCIIINNQYVFDVVRSNTGEFNLMFSGIIM